jgi:glucose/arabinose dehydrogenase
MTTDQKGRLIISPQGDDQPLLRITLTRSGKISKIEKIPAPVHQAMGLLYAYDSLYVNGHGPEGTGLYRLIDSNHNDRFDTNEVRFLKKIGGEGEHGYHALVMGPDKMIYMMNGNHTKLPAGIDPASPHKNYEEDLLLPRQWDANGHAVGILAPGGYIVRTDPEGKKWELMLAGFRNSYDFDFNADGEIFTFDSDMEWDWGLPWYRPTRIIHCVTGGEYGWRSGSSNEPEYYADTLPAAVNIGVGSPTGVKFGTRSKFPAKYRRAFFAFDWSYGRIFAVHLIPQGASYQAEYEDFVKGKPLNLTDLEFGKDGAMYISDDAAGAVYRVTFQGK